MQSLKRFHNVDVNRDWQDLTTVATSTAKPIIQAFNPIVGIDVHCNGSTMLAIPNIGIEFQFGTHNDSFRNAVNPYSRSYYNSDANMRPSTHDTTRLANVFQDEMEILGGLIEMRWWLKDAKGLHNSQVESLNYSVLVNAIKYFDCVHTQTEYKYEHTPNQNQY